MTYAITAQTDFSFVHFTDTHIMADGSYIPATRAWPCDTQASWQRVISVMNALEPPPAFAAKGKGAQQTVPLYLYGMTAG